MLEALHFVMLAPCFAMGTPHFVVYGSKYLSFVKLVCSYAHAAWWSSGVGFLSLSHVFVRIQNLQHLHVYLELERSWALSRILGLRLKALPW